eukprot:g7716.t1
MSAAKVKVLYQTHIVVTGVRNPTSVDPVNGTVTVVSPSTNNNTIDDPDVVAFISTSVYEIERNSAFKDLTCSYGSVVNGTSDSCHKAITLENQTKRQAIDDITRVFMRVSQSMFLENNNRNRRRFLTITKRNLGSNDFKELNAVFKGVILKIPDQSIEQRIWPSTLKIQITKLLCGEVSIGDINIIGSQPSASVVSANIRLLSLNIMCSANYRYEYGWFGGSGSMSAGGSQQSIDTSITIGNDGTSSINSCTSNVDLTHLSFSGGITSSIADTFKSMFRSKLETTLEATICDELGPLGSDLITDLATVVKKETDPYVPTTNGGSYVDNTEDPLLKENSLVDEYQSSLISWKDTLINTSSNDPIAMFVPKVFATINEYLSNNESGINHFLRQYVLDNDNRLVINFTNTTSKRGLILYDGVDPLTSTSLAISHIIVRGLDQWSVFRPLVVIGEQTFGHEIKMKGKLSASASLTLRIGPSTAEDSLIHQHQGHTVYESPQISISLSDLNFDAATYLGISKAKALSMKLGSIGQAPLECLASAVDEMEIRKFLATILDIEEPALSGFLSAGIDKLFSQALHVVYLKYENRMKLALPKYLTTTGSDIINNLIVDFLKSHDQRYKKTCPNPAIHYHAGQYINFRTNYLWNQFQSTVLGPFLENNASSLISLLNSSTSGGSLHNILGDNLTKSEVDTGSNMLGNLKVFAGNIGVQGLTSMHNVELLTANSQHYGTNFAGVDAWLPVDHNLSKYLLSTAISIGTDENPLQGSVDIYIGVPDGGAANDHKTFLNDFTLTVGVSELEMLVQMLVKIDMGHIEHLQLRHITHLDCWVTTVGQLMFHQVQAKVVGSLFAGIKCRTCTSPGFRDLQKTLSTEEASKDLTELVNQILDFVSNLVESKTVQDEINTWISDSKQRCTIAAGGYAPDGAFQDIDKLKVDTTDIPHGTVRVDRQDAALDYTMFALAGAAIGGLIMLSRFYKKEKKWQRDLIALEKELKRKNAGKNKGFKEATPLISATSSLFYSPHVPCLIRIGVPLVLVANAGFFLSGHLSLGALVRLYLNIAGEDITIPSVFTFSMAQSTIDMWTAGGKILAVILVIFSGMWPYTKVCISIFLWMAPPTWYAPSSRGSAFMWLDALGKWSIIDIFVLVLSMVGFHLLIESPVVSFLPPNFWTVEVSVVPVWGLFANLIAQIQSQIISHICIYYHRNSVAAVEEELGYKLLDVKKLKKIFEQQESRQMIENPMQTEAGKRNKQHIGDLPSIVESFDGISSANTNNKARKEKKSRTRNRASTTWLNSQDNIIGPRKALVNIKASLRNHFFEMKSDYGEAGAEIGRLRVQVSPCGQWIIILGIIITEILLIIGTTMPSFYMNTHGLAGIAIDIGKTNSSAQKYSIIKTVQSIGNQVDVDDVGSVLGIGSIAGLFLLTTVIVPSLQLFALLLMWILNLNLENQKRLYLINEALGAWQYLEVYIIAIGVATLQMADISAQIAAPLCRDLDGTFDVLASLGIVEPINASCFTVLAGIEHGMYVLLVGAILLNAINVLVTKAAVAALQDREARLRGDVLEGKVERPKSFFRDSCIKYLLFSCCCCVRYVAEELDNGDEEVEDETDTSYLSNMSGSRQRRVASLVNQWDGNHQNRKTSMIDIFVPKEKNGLPPHWEEVVSKDGEVYYWQSLTGVTQWERPVRGKRADTDSNLTRTEVVDPDTGKIYYWNQTTGSTRWKPNQEV